MLQSISVSTTHSKKPSLCVYCQVNPATIKCLTCYKNNTILRLCPDCDKDIH